MPDAQIVASQVEQAPLDYEVPAAVSFILKAVNAEFDGSGAAGAYLPVVEISSDSGHRVALAVDPSVAVAAGGSANVSFFPRGRGGSGAVASSADAYPMHEAMPVLSFDFNGVFFSGWNSHPTVDAACINNGYSASGGLVDSFICFRTMLGPQGSIHSFNWLHLTGPDYGQVFIYLASLAEDDSNSGAADPTNVLQDISAATFILVAKIDFFSVALARNVQHNSGVTGPGLNLFNSTPFRVLGAPGTPFTARGFDGNLNLATIDGGPGPYAVMLKMEAKAGASTGFKVGIQELNRQRNDWAFS